MMRLVKKDLSIIHLCMHSKEQIKFNSMTCNRYLFSSKKDPNIIKQKQQQIKNYLVQKTLMPGISKLKSPSISPEYRKLWYICRPESKKYLFNTALTFVHAALFMYIPYIYNDLTFLMSLKISQVSTSEILIQYLLMTCKWAAVFGTLGVTTYRRRYEFIDISNRISIRLRNVLYKQILQRDFYKQNQIPQTFVHHLITDVKTVSQFTGQSIFAGLRGISFLIGGISMLIYTSPYISIIAIAIMTAFNISFRGRNQTLKQLKQKENSILVNLSEFSSQRFHNMKLIKISNTQMFEQYKFMQELKKFYEYSKKVAEANGINYGSLQCFGLFSLFSVAATGSFLISMQVTEFSLIASSTYAMYVALGFRNVMFFKTELMKILGVYSNIEQKLGDLTKLPEYSSSKFFIDELNYEQQKLEKLFSEKYPVQQKGVAIKVENLYFTYVYEDKSHKMESHLYQNFSLDIGRGETIAIVGDSGTGKSTLFNLITKLSQPASGKIFIENQEINEMAFQDMQKIVSYVTQQSFMFAGTFQENLRYGNHGFDLSAENIEKCLKMVNAWDLIQQKGGLSARVEQKGANLSGGERQRVILARALIKHPRLLLLDEATSGIDSESQKLIIESLQQFKHRMTTIIITHKLQPFLPIISRTIHLKYNKNNNSTNNDNSQKK